MKIEKPLIGITTSVQEDEQRLHVSYTRAVEEAGAIALIVPLFEHQSDLIAFSSLLDGLVITGGPAITINLIGELPPDINETDARRTRNDQWILERILSANKPILGICYGMQLINAHFGGSIYADVQKHLNLEDSHSEKRGGRDHRLIAVPGTHFDSLMGTPGSDEEIRLVNTRHIQAIADPGTGLRISAESPDHVIEGIETDDGRVIGVQFHPERMGRPGAGLFRNLVDRARS